MTIRKGAAWGRPGRLDDTRALWFDDASAARAFHSELPDRFRMAIAPGADMATTLGVTAGAQQEAVLAGDEATVVPIDLGIARLDGGPPRPFLAHCVAHRGRRRLSTTRPWRGRFVVVMNAAWHGDWYLAPKGHPNDGRLDLTDGSIPAREWREFAKRAATGSHLPHPDLSTFQVKTWSTDFDKPTFVWTDGVRMGWCRRLEIEVVADAGEIVI